MVWGFVHLFGFFFLLLNLRCIPALFLVNETYSGAWKEKLYLGVRQRETAARKRSSPWERSDIRLSEPSPAQRAPTGSRSSPEDRVMDGRRLWSRSGWREGAGGRATPARSLPLI